MSPPSKGMPGSTVVADLAVMSNPYASNYV
jgi:hypothetical protein